MTKASPAIPEMIHPLGKHWSQPERSEIKFAFGRAWVSPETFKKLAHYEVTNPSGVYAGKMWRRAYRVKTKDTWVVRNLLCWYADSATEGYCDIKQIDLMTDEKPIAK